jgi:hypothetical protein
VSAEDPFGLRDDVVSDTLRNPQLEPADHCYTILQDFGPHAGGWGPVAISLPWLKAGPAPFVYTGHDLDVLEKVAQACVRLAAETGRPTRLVRFSVREDLAAFGGGAQLGRAGNGGGTRRLTR